MIHFASRLRTSLSLSLWHIGGNQSETSMPPWSDIFGHRPSLTCCMGLHRCVVGCILEGHRNRLYGTSLVSLRLPGRPTSITTLSLTMYPVSQASFWTPKFWTRWTCASMFCLIRVMHTATIRNFRENCWRLLAAWLHRLLTDIFANL